MFAKPVAPAWAGGSRFHSNILRRRCLFKIAHREIRMDGAAGIQAWCFRTVEPGERFLRHTAQDQTIPNEKRELGETMYVKMICDTYGLAAWRPYDQPKSFAASASGN